jgi:hypothetical protein
MPTQSTYYFEDVDLRGRTDFIHVFFLGSAVRTVRPDDGGRKSVLALVRPDDEEVVDMLPQVNQPVVLDVLRNTLGDNATLRSGVRLGWEPFKHVPYFNQVPTAHDPLELLLRVSFDVNVQTPSWCLDVEATISYFIHLHLDQGQVAADVEGWAFTTGQGSACREGVRGALRQRVPAGMAVVQGLIDTSLRGFADRRFRMLYLLPGPGENTGAGVHDVGNHVSVALVPRMNPTRELIQLAKLLDQ